MTRGGILAEQAYAQGKMLNHEGWKILPRRITPSDVDMCFDNNGWILACELSSSKPEWGEISKGQLWLYKSITSKSRTMAALLKHSVRNRQIDTLNDIDSFQVMICGGRITGRFDGSRWQSFVEAFFDSPTRLHLRCYEDCKAVL